MGGVVDSVFGGGDSGGAPDAPDYTAAAKATAEGNLELARAQLAANRVNQTTPYGTLQYKQTGKDEYGNPTYTATQKLNAAEQRILDAQRGITRGALGAANLGLGNVNEALSQGSVDMSQLPSYGINPGEMYSDAIMRRLQPQIEMETNQFETRLANQGIAPGTEAYINAKRSFDQAQNDKMTSAVVGGMQTGLQANQQAYGQAQSNLQSPVNLFNAVRQGSQVNNPSYVNPASMSQVQGPDLLGAANQQYGNQVSMYNADQARNASMTSGLMNTGATIGAAYFL